jgi:site-specific DNA recombinase
MNRPGAVYARRSVEDAANPGLSIPFQVERGLQFWAAKNIAVPPEHIYIDADLSGKNLTDRPAALQLLKAMTDKAVQGVWCYNVDRLTRNLYDLPTLQQAADAGQCAVYAGDRQLDWVNPEAEVGLIVEATFASYYRKRIAKNTREALHKKAQDGLWAGGRVPFWLRSEGRGKLALDENWVPVLIRIFEEYVAGRTTVAIAEGLQRDGVPTPRGGLRWQHKTIAKVLCHPVHLGRVLYGGSDVPTDVPRAVPEDLAEAAHQRIVRTTYKRGPNTVSHELFRLVWCECGSACHRRRKVSRGIEHYSLVCNNTKLYQHYGAEQCRMPSVPWTMVDSLLSAIVAVIRDSQPTVREWTAPPDMGARLVELEERKRIETAVLRSGGCTIAEYEAAMRSINAELARLAPPPPPEEPGRYRGIAAMWNDLGIAERNALLHQLLESVIITQRRVEVRWRDLGWEHWPKMLIMLRSTHATRLVF